MAAKMMPRDDACCNFSFNSHATASYYAAKMTILRTRRHLSVTTKPDIRLALEVVISSSNKLS